MIRVAGERVSRTLLLLGVLYLLCQPAWSPATDYAMPMDKAATSLLLDIAAAGSRLVAVGERGHILYSADQGQSWTQARVPTAVMLTRVFFISRNLGWAVGHDGHVLASRDGGVNWELQRDGVSAQADINEERAALAAQAVQELRARLGTAEDDLREDLLPDLEDAQYALDTAREVLNEPVYAPPLMDVWFANESEGWAAGAFGTLLHTHNGGRQWNDLSHQVNNPEELHFNGVVVGPDGSLYLASEWGMVFRSGSGGETWEAVETGYDGSFFGIAVNPVNGTVFAYGLRGTIYRSRDEGLSWEQVESRARASLFGAHARADGALVFVGQDGTVILSQDDGESFTKVMQSSRRGLHGVAPLPDGRYAITGEGGSQVLDRVAATGGGAPQ